MVFCLVITIVFSAFTSIGSAETQSHQLTAKPIEITENSQLIEWFSSTNCEKCRIFENQNKNKNYTWISWFDSDNDKFDTLARDDAKRRLEQLNVSAVPLLIVDGDIVKLNLNDTIAEWSDLLNQSINKNKNNNLINLSLNVELIDTIGKNIANEIRLYGQITPLSNLHNNTAIHIHLVENIADADGSGARPYIPNVLREWVPRMDFSVEGQNTTEWEYTLSETYLESANVNLNEGVSDRYSLIISVHGDERENETQMNVLKIAETQLPSIHKQANWSGFPLILLGNIILIVGLGFVVIQEKIREQGLPLIEGKILESKEGINKINLNVKTGNKKVEILGIEVNNGWRTSKVKNLPTILPKSNLDFKFNALIKSQNKDEVLPLKITVKTDVEDLGQWMMDFEMILEKNE